ncbi:hypothetical protein [Brucella sp. IR073]|uniref:hypothetical protein n=1 Tax=unclassified Brucella TaxID=2632610 RepID=UPI003B97FD9E
MSKALTNPLAGIVAAASKKLPAKTGAVQEHAHRVATGADVVILADTSGSMFEMAGRRRKIDILSEALTVVRGDLPSATTIAFDSLPKRLAPHEPLPAPDGGTALHLAIDEAARLRPRKTIVITDGQPDNERQAISSAGRLTGTIDVIYCGNDNDTQAIDFLRRLAAAAGGTIIVHDLKRYGEASVKAIASAAATLALPAPKHGA